MAGIVADGAWPPAGSGEVGGSRSDGDGQGPDRRQREARQGYEPMPPEQRVEQILATERRMIELVDDGGRATSAGRIEVAGRVVHDPGGLRLSSSSVGS